MLRSTAVSSDEFVKIMIKKKWGKKIIRKYGIVKVKENLVGEGKGRKNVTEEEIRGGRVGQ